MTNKRLRAICGLNDGPDPPEPRPHAHPGLELGIVVSGEEIVYFGDHKRECMQGDVWLCGMWESHSWYVPNAGTRTVVLIFPPEFIGGEIVCGVPCLTLFALPPEDRLSVNSPGVRRQVIQIGQSMRAEIARGEPHWEEVVRLELLRLLTILARDLGTLEERRVARRKRLSGLARVMPAFGLVHSELSRRVKVKEAADACGMSPSRFHIVFRQTMGMTFGEFGLKSRLSFAAHELENTDRTIASIAAASGFSDDSHLHHCFRKEYSCTPAEYRERAHGMRERATEDGRRIRVTPGRDGVEWSGAEE
jgi:AraC-like DNA-binding protein